MSAAPLCQCMRVFLKVGGPPAPLPAFRLDTPHVALSCTAGHILGLSDAIVGTGAALTIDLGGNFCAEEFDVVG